MGTAALSKVPPVPRSSVSPTPKPRHLESEDRQYLNPRPFDTSDLKTFSTSNLDLRHPAPRTVGLSDLRHLRSEDLQHLRSSTPVSPENYAPPVKTLDTSSLPKPRYLELSMLSASSFGLLDPTDSRHLRSEDRRHLQSTRPQKPPPETVGLSSSQKTLTPPTRRSSASPIRGFQHLQSKALGTSSLEPSTPPVRRPLASPTQNLRYLRSNNLQHLELRTANVSDPKALDITEPSLEFTKPQTRRSSASRIQDLRRRRPEGLWHRFSTTASCEEIRISAKQNARNRRSEDPWPRLLRAASTRHAPEPSSSRTPKDS